MTPIQQYNHDNLDYYQNKPLSEYDTYGGYSQTGIPGVSTAAMMDPDVASYFNEEYQAGNSIPESIRQKMATMDGLYSTSGWDGVLQHTKDYWTDLGKQGVVNADLNPNKKLADGGWTWEDTLGALSVLAIPVGGLALSGAAAGAGAGAAATGAEGASIAGGLGAAGAGSTAGATAGGLAGTLGLDAAIPTVTVTGAAGGAGGLGSAASGLGAIGGAGSLATTLGGNTPNITNPMTGNGDITAPDGVSGNDPATASNWINTIKGVGQLGSTINDYINGNNTSNNLKDYMGTLSSMYAPGSPEAKLMEQQLDAKDAAAGRNSQYGIRAQNLAAMLTQARAGVLTNNNYFGALTGANSANNNKLNSLFSAMGNAGQTYNNISSGISSLAGLFS